MFTDDGISAEFDGIDDSDDGIDFTGDTTILSTNSTEADATQTISLNVGADGEFNETSEFSAGTGVDIVITTAEGTQAESSFIIEDPLDPQLSAGDEIRLN